MSTPATADIVDVTIIGGGPTGLAAAYYAGHREASVRIIDSLEELGGQVMAVYPEKHIFDVAGHPKIQGAAFCNLMIEQAMQFDPHVALGENCSTMEHIERDGEALIRLVGESGTEYLTRTVIITAGHGAFSPRTLPLEGIDQWRRHGLHYLVKRIEDFRDQRVVIVGGGDSALDWTLGLQGVAASPLTLVHRRDRFRAVEHSVSQMRALAEAGAVDLRVPAQVTAIDGDTRIQRVQITCDDAEPQWVDCDALITLLGFSSALGSIADWGLEFAGRKTIKVTAKMETNLPNVFAAGDVAWYDGKITLITIGMGEAAIAANWAITRFRPEEKVQPKYSTE